MENSSDQGSSSSSEADNTASVFFPPELILNIMDQLNSRELERMRGVSKNLNETIIDNLIAKKKQQKTVPHTLSDIQKLSKDKEFDLVFDEHSYYDGSGEDEEEDEKDVLLNFARKSPVPVDNVKSILYRCDRTIDQDKAEAYARYFWENVFRTYPNLEELTLRAVHNMDFWEFCDVSNVPNLKVICLTDCEAVRIVKLNGTQADLILYTCYLDETIESADFIIYSSLIAIKNMSLINFQALEPGVLFTQQRNFPKLKYMILERTIVTNHLGLLAIPDYIWFMNQCTVRLPTDLHNKQYQFLAADRKSKFIEPYRIDNMLEHPLLFVLRAVVKRVYVTQDEDNRGFPHTDSLYVNTYDRISLNCMCLQFYDTTSASTIVVRNWVSYDPAQAQRANDYAKFIMIRKITTGSYESLSTRMDFELPPNEAANKRQRTENKLNGYSAESPYEFRFNDARTLFTLRLKNLTSESKTSYSLRIEQVLHEVSRVNTKHPSLYMRFM